MKPLSPVFSLALKKLKTKPLSTAQLKKLLNEAFPDQTEATEETLQELATLGLVGDNKLFADVVSYWSQKGVGRRRILLEVKKRGCPAHLLDTLLKAEGWNEETAAQKALDAKARSLREKDPFKRRQKLAFFLRSRGFGEAVIYKVCSQTEERNF